MSRHRTALTDKQYGDILKPLFLIPGKHLACNSIEFNVYQFLVPTGRAHIPEGEESIYFLLARIIDPGKLFLDDS
jgi:hypothetical protein